MKSSSYICVSCGRSVDAFGPHLCARIEMDKPNDCATDKPFWCVVHINGLGNGRRFSTYDNTLHSSYANAEKSGRSQAEKYPGDHFFVCRATNMFRTIKPQVENVALVEETDE